MSTSLSVLASKRPCVSTYLYLCASWGEGRLSQFSRKQVPLSAPERSRGMSAYQDVSRRRSGHAKGTPQRAQRGRLSLAASVCCC